MKRRIAGILGVLLGLLIFGIAAFSPIVYRNHQLVSASDAVLGQIESMYTVYGFTKARQYCEELGVFEQGAYHFKCYVNKGGKYGPEGDFTTRSITVGVYADASSAESMRDQAIHGQRRFLLRVPFLPSTSTVWEDDWGRRGT